MITEVLHVTFIALCTVIAVLVAACIIRWGDGRTATIAEIKEDIREDA